MGDILKGILIAAVVVGIGLAIWDYFSPTGFGPAIRTISVRIAFMMS